MNRFMKGIIPKYKSMVTTKTKARLAFFDQWM